jgi:thiol-disulfide isomerase/thioredoxin
VSFFSRLRSSGALPVEGHLPGFDGATGWLNSPPLSAADLQGKVVLVDFWTYTCINWLRTLAYVRAWAEKYQDQGLVVVGVHTPEFPFERDVDNVRQAVKDMAIGYPSRSTATTRSGKRSPTDFGPRSTSPTRKGESGTTNSARADTQNAKWSSSGC